MRIRLLSRVKSLGGGTIVLLLIVLVILLWSNLTQWRSSSLDTVRCDSIINVHKEDKLLSVRLKYCFLGNDGIATLSGFLKESDKDLVNISRHVFFKYKQIDNGVYLENTHTNISLQDNASSDELNNLLPDFYTSSGARTNFQVYMQQPGGYVFVKEFTPAFYCTKQ
ncbi:hypothetical protein [Klebsiella aerogenes]|uniref:hypothetical protein n=1 Tax=Klebsiella aerogenes TaxID=548 RepID=UPI003A92308C